MEAPYITTCSPLFRNRVMLPLACVLVALAGLETANAQCVDYSDDPAGCQPSPFDTPIGEMPSIRVGQRGQVDPFSSEEEAREGFSRLEKDLHLFRNFEHLHWVITVPSERDPGTGAWRGGDLDGAGDGRGSGYRGRLRLRRAP